MASKRWPRINFDKSKYKSIDDIFNEVQDVKKFGRQLGLEFGNAFSKMSFSRERMYCWIYASFKDELSSPLPSGDPCEFFGTDSKTAIKKARELKKQGHDVHFRKESIVPNEDCPVSPELLESHQFIRIEDMLHEGFHLYHEKKGMCLPYNLEESLASYVGLKGAQEYLLKINGELTTYERNQLRNWIKFSNYIGRFYGILESFYKENKDISKRDEIFKWAKREDPGLYESQKIINNAYFLRQIDYTRHFKLVHDMLEKVGLSNYLSSPSKTNKELLSKVEA